MGKLTIQEVAHILTTKNGLEQREATQFANDFFSLIQEQLEQGEPVKVKGLGTFKIVGVGARESVSVRTGERVVIDSHSKVSFTPDATMRELVNKPFSQFETVVLNDGVEFEDLADDVTEDELVALEQSVQQPKEPEPIQEQSVLEALPVMEASEIIDTPEPVDSPKAIETAEVLKEPEHSEDSVPEMPVSPEVPVIPKDSVSTVEEVDEEEDEASASDDEYEDETNDDNYSRPWVMWVLGTLGVIVLMALSAYGGYEYGCALQQPVLVDTIVVNDTVFVADIDLKDSIFDEDEVSDELIGNATPQQAPEASASVHQEKQQPAAQPVASETDIYAQKDERVRLGAYRIIGLDHEVKVLEGQTFYSICRAHLGPDMECYVEVYNDLPRNPLIKVGQTIKIPKLQLKKRRK